MRSPTIGTVSGMREDEVEVRKRRECTGEEKIGDRARRVLRNLRNDRRNIRRQ
jgi:hypothetical protein